MRGRGGTVPNPATLRAAATIATAAGLAATLAIAAGGILGLAGAWIAVARVLAEESTPQ